MMKKLLFVISLMAGVCTMVQAQITPTIVGIEVENRNVVLEEYTGIHCVFCPDGHFIAHQLMLENPDDFFTINIHQGSFANPNAGEPDFRTPFGDSLAAQCDLVGYPAGTINRHIFQGMSQGSGTAMSRTNWDTTMNMMLGEVSYLNVGAEASLDVNTSELTVHVEVYYTGDSPEATNYLNVALLESNVEGPQTGGANFNPDFVLPNGNYSHQHILRHLITGQWGEEINTTNTGSFIDRYYTYTIPGDYNGVEVNLSQFSLVAFVAETTQEIVSATQAIPELLGLNNANDAGVAHVLAPDVVCGNEVVPSVIIRNNGNQLLTSLEIEYDVNGGASATYSWTGEMVPLALETVELPAITFTQMATNVVTVNLAMPNGADDEDPSNNTGTCEFFPPVSTTLNITLELMTDNYGYETSWELMDSEGIVLYSSGSLGNNSLTIDEFEIEPGNCYAFVIYDNYGDGICCNFGEGYYTLTDSDGTEIYSGGGFGASETTEFNAIITDIEGIQKSAGLSVYPNPAHELVNIVCSKRIKNVSLTSLTGQLLQQIEVNDSYLQLNTSTLKAGIYFIKIKTEDTIINRRLVIE